MTTDIDWKARAEAAEAERDDYREKWKGAGAAAMRRQTEIEKRDARIADLEARLARVPDREAVARAIEALPRYERGDWPREHMVEHPEGTMLDRDEVLAAIAAMQAPARDISQKNTSDPQGIIPIGAQETNPDE